MTHTTKDKKGGWKEMEWNGNGENTNKLKHTHTNEKIHTNKLT